VGLRALMSFIARTLWQRQQQQQQQCQQAKGLAEPSLPPHKRQKMAAGGLCILSRSRRMRGLRRQFGVGLGGFHVRHLARSSLG